MFKFKAPDHSAVDAGIVMALSVLKHSQYKAECDLIYQSEFVDYIAETDCSHELDAHQHAHESVADWCYENPLSTWEAE